MYSKTKCEGFVRLNQPSVGRASHYCCVVRSGGRKVTITKELTVGTRVSRRTVEWDGADVTVSTTTGPEDEYQDRSCRTLKSLYGRRQWGGWTYGYVCVPGDHEWRGVTYKSPVIVTLLYLTPSLTHGDSWRGERGAPFPRVGRRVVPECVRYLRNNTIFANTIQAYSGKNFK